MVTYIRSAGAHTCRAPQKFGQDFIRIGKIGEAGIVFVRIPGRGLGGKVLVKTLPRLFGAAGVDLAPVITGALIRVGEQTIGS